MLQHVIKVQVLDLILGCVDLVVAVLEVTLNDEGTGVASLASTGVIRACVAALGQDVRNVAVCGDNLLDELSEAGVHEIGDDTNTLWLSSIKCLLDVAGHVLLEHGLDITPSLLVGLEDGLRTKQTALLSTVPVKLDSILLFAADNVLVEKQNTQSLENGDSARTVIISTGGSKKRGEEEVDTVLVGTDDNRLVRLARKSGNDRVLSPGVLKVLDACTVLQSSSVCEGIVDLAEQPE